MKQIVIVLLSLIFFFSFNLFAVENNNFYDNEPVHHLKVAPLTIKGEIINQGTVDFSRFKIHDLVTKEAKLTDQGVTFVGTYRYKGYSLFDLLQEKYLKKKNQSEFSPIIDLLVEIKNQKGEKVVLSWGEIYYPSNQHRIIIASSVSAVNPFRSNEKWAIPSKSRLIMGNDLYSNRYLEEPTVIKVFSAPYSFKVNRGLNPLYSDKIVINKNRKPIGEITVLDSKIEKREYRSVFLGRGMGFHGIGPFKGNLFYKELEKYFRPTISDLASGYIVISAQDGYRLTISMSQLFNRNDSAEFILIDRGKDQPDGRFSLFAPNDFFSDRAIKAITGIFIHCQE